MKRVRTMPRFERDLRMLHGRGRNVSPLWDLIEILPREEPLASSYLRHRLTGEYHDRWECHIEADWLVIWVESRDTVRLVRTGSHADLFG